MMRRIMMRRIIMRRQLLMWKVNVGKMLKGNNDAVETSPSDGIEDKMKSFTIMFIIRTVHAMYVRI